MHCKRKLKNLAVWAMVLTLNLSCERLSDQVDSKELTCGRNDTADSRLFKIEGPIPANEPEVWHINPQGEFARIPVNSKNCFAAAAKSEGFLLVKSAGTEGTLQGTVLHIQAQAHQESIESLKLAPLKIAESQIQLCSQKSLFTRDSELLLPLTYATPGFDSFLVIEAEGPSGIFRRVLAEGLGLREANIHLKDLKPGTNAISFRVYDLFLSARRTSEQRCEAILDKDAPQVRIKDTQNRFLSDSTAEFLPGDKLVVEANEASELQYCFQSKEKQDKLECGPVPSSGVLGLPSSGHWLLSIYATDPAGNRISSSHHLRVFNRTAVDLIRTQAQGLTERDSSSDPRLAIKLEEERLKLAGSDEQTGLEIDTKVSMLSALVRTQERSRVAIACPNRGPHVRIADVLVVSYDSAEACLYQLDGKFLGKVSHPSLNYLFEKYPRVTQNRYAVFASKSRMFVLDTVERTIREIALPAGSRNLKAFDVDPTQGSIYALIDKSFVTLDFDGKLVSSLALSGEYFDLTLIAKENATKMIFRYLDFRQNFSEICDLQRLACSVPTEGEFFRSDRYWVNESSSHLVTIYDNNTLVWTTAELYDLNRESAFNIPGQFIRFLDDRHMLVQNQDSYTVWELKRYTEVHTQPISPKGIPPFLYDTNQKQGIEIVPSGFNRWQESKFSEAVQLVDQSAWYGNFNSQGNELTLFTRTHVIRYFLAYQPTVNQRNYVFAGKRSGLYLRSESELIYTDAKGEHRTFSGDNISVTMSPQRKFALIINSRDRGIWSVINEKGEELASSLDSGNTLPDGVWLTNEDETLVHLPRAKSPHLVIDTTNGGQRYIIPSEKRENPSDPSSPLIDRYKLLLTSMEDRIVLVGDESVELYNLKSGLRQVLSQGFIFRALNFVKYPLVSYVVEDDTSRKRILQTLDGSRRLDWEDDTYFDTDNLEDCGVFVLKHAPKITLVDLNDFSQHEYEAMDVRCYKSAKRLTLVDTDRSENRLLAPNLEAVINLPANVMQADAQGFWLRSPDFTTLTRFLLQENGTSVSKTFSSLRYQGFDLLNYIMVKNNSDFGTIYTAEIYDTQLGLVASRVILPDYRPGLFTGFGPLVWNHDTDEILEMSDDKDSQPEFIPSPSWDGIRFLPFDNTRLLEALEIWTGGAG